MKISVVTVCYNAVGTIEKAMLSVLGQTYSDIEYIIIDGGSTDGTVDIIQKYADRISYWVSEPDKGIYDAMNKGIKKANGNFLFFLGADDLLFNENAINNALVKFDSGDCIYYGDTYITCIRKIYAGKFNRFRLSINNISHQALFYPKSVYKHKEYDTRYNIYADYVYNIELFRRCKFVYVDETISIFNYGGISSTCNDCFFKERYSKLVLENLGVIPFIINRLFSFYRFIKRIF